MYRVLIVHDEEILRKALVRAIPWRSLDCEVLGTARNGLEAFRTCASSMPDIILTDASLPEMSAEELLHRLSVMDREVMTIVVSGYGDKLHKEHALSLGAKVFMLKPVSKEDLTAALLGIVQELKETEERRDAVKESALFIRASVLMLLSNPDDTENLLHTFRPRLRRSPDAFLVKAEDGKALSALERKYSLEPVLSPVLADKDLYSLYLSPVPKDALKAGRKTSAVFCGKAEEAVRRFSAALSRARRLSVTGKDGMEMEIPSTAQYLKRISMLSGNISSTLEEGTGSGAVLSCLSLEEAVDALLRFVLQRERKGNSVLYDAIRTAGNAETAETIASFLDKLPASFLANESCSYPVRLMKEYLQGHAGDETVSLKKFSSKVLSMDPSYLGEIFEKETGTPFAALDTQ